MAKQRKVKNEVTKSEMNDLNTLFRRMSLNELRRSTRERKPVQHLEPEGQRRGTFRRKSSAAKAKEQQRKATEARKERFSSARNMNKEYDSSLESEHAEHDYNHHLPASDKEGKEEEDDLDLDLNKLNLGDKKDDLDLDLNKLNLGDKKDDLGIDLNKLNLGDKKDDLDLNKLNLGKKGGRGKTNKYIKKGSYRRKRYTFRRRHSNKTFE